MWPYIMGWCLSGWTASTEPCAQKDCKTALFSFYAQAFIIVSHAILQRVCVLKQFVVKKCKISIPERFGISPHLNAVAMGRNCADRARTATATAADVIQGDVPKMEREH